jgi:molecular chaperone GrpE
VRRPAPPPVARAAGGGEAVAIIHGMDERRDVHDQPAPEGTDGSAATAGDAAAAEIQDLRRQLEEKQDRLLRAMAETDNLRRRSQREREEYVRYANESLLRDLVPVLDNLDRALEAARAAGSAGGLLAGVELIQREFLRVLERAGVTRYSAVGQPFDPTRHEAISRIVSAEAPAGTVVAETLPGYLLNGRVLRAAMVAVAAAPDEDAA